MKTLELITSIFLVSGCDMTPKSINPFDLLKDINEEIKRIPAQGVDPNLKLSMGSETIEFQPHKIEPSRMTYPYIDGASPECRRLTEVEMQTKRSNPEKSITCGGIL